MSGCVTGKKMYATEVAAEEALIASWLKYDYSRGEGPIAIYRCEDCREFHLTSQGKMNDKLSVLLANGDLKKGKEAAEWLDKLNRRR